MADSQLMLICGCEVVPHRGLSIKVDRQSETQTEISMEPGDGWWFDPRMNGQLPSAISLALQGGNVIISYQWHDEQALKGTVWTFMNTKIVGRHPHRPAFKLDAADQPTIVIVQPIETRLPSLLVDDPIRPTDAPNSLNGLVQQSDQLLQSARKFVLPAKGGK